MNKELRDELLCLAKRFYLEAIAPDEKDVERLHEALVDGDIAAMRALLQEYGL